MTRKGLIQCVIRDDNSYTLGKIVRHCAAGAIKARERGLRRRINSSSTLHTSDLKSEKPPELDFTRVCTVHALDDSQTVNRI